MGAIEDAWRSVDSSSSDVTAAAKKLLATAVKLSTASTSGVLAGTTKALESLSEELGLVSAALDAARVAVGRVQAELAPSNALAKEIEAELRTMTPDRKVWRSMSDVVAFPVVVGVRQPKVAVDKVQVGSQRPGIIIGTVLDALKGSWSPDRFLRALHGAFLLVNGGRSTGQASLVSLHQVLTTVPPGTNAYSIADFKVDLQWLYASGTRSVGEVTVRFDVASAGPSAVPVYDGEGNLLNLGYATFVESAGADV